MEGGIDGAEREARERERAWGWMDNLMDGWIDGWIDRWIDGWIDGWIWR